MAKEYATTMSYVDHNENEDEPDIVPQEPKHGDNWTMCGSTATCMPGMHSRLYWFWVRDDVDDDLTRFEPDRIP